MEGVPAAYVNLVDALCFIKWTTNCYYGNR